MQGGGEGAACVSEIRSENERMISREARGAPREWRAAMKELDGASDILKDVSALPKKGLGRELNSLSLYRINLINS